MGRCQEQERWLLGDGDGRTDDVAQRHLLLGHALCRQACLVVTSHSVLIMLDPLNVGPLWNVDVGSIESTSIESGWQ